MFYSDSFCVMVYQWLESAALNGCEFRALIGDPGRSFWSEDYNPLREKCEKIYEIEFDENVIFEYPGFHTGSVYKVTNHDFFK